MVKLIKYVGNTDTKKIEYYEDIDTARKQARYFSEDIFEEGLNGYAITFLTSNDIDEIYHVWRNPIDRKRHYVVYDMELNISVEYANPRE